jgi:hypothetical protein
MSKVTISKGVIEDHIDTMLNRLQHAVQGTPLVQRELEAMQEMLWRIKHYIDQGETE